MFGLRIERIQKHWLFNQPRGSSYRRDVRRINQIKTKAKDIREVLKKGGFEPDPAYLEGGDFLRSIGMINQAEISRVLDIAMNPDSLFLSERERRISTASARRLSVEQDMKPVVQYFQGVGISDEQIVMMISKMPSILGYDIEKRIRPVVEYLDSIGLKDPIKTIAKRPSLLGLDVEQNLKKIVEYLRENNYDVDQIVELLETSI